MKLIDKYLLEAKKGKKFGTSFQRWFTARMKDLKFPITDMEDAIREGNPQELYNSLNFMKDYIDTVLLPPLNDVEGIQRKK